jgi:nitrate/TMAO reductase-like tetraheme cytochrome c subunit
MYNKAYFANLRAKRKAAGLCLACGKHPYPCEFCRKKNKERMQKIRAGIPLPERQKSWKTQRDYFLKRKFGINEQIYNEMLLKQNNSCAICKKTNSGDKRTKNLAVDHCHKTGIIRGLLCAACNKGLGLFEDSEKI